LQDIGYQKEVRKEWDERLKIWAGILRKNTFWLLYPTKK
jgi:hypothetical protein